MPRNHNFDDEYDDYDQPRHRGHGRGSPLDDYYNESPYGPSRPSRSGRPSGFSSGFGRDSNTGRRNLYEDYQTGRGNPYDNLYQQEHLTGRGTPRANPGTGRGNPREDIHAGLGNPDVYAGLENNLRRGLGRSEIPGDQRSRSGHNDRGPSSSHHSPPLRLSESHVRTHRAIMRQICLDKCPRERLSSGPVASYDVPAVREATHDMEFYMPYLEAMVIALRAEGNDAAQYGDDPPVLLGFYPNPEDGRWYAVWADE